MKLTDNLDRIVDKNSPAYITLYTFREAIKLFFGISSLPLIQSQDVKRELKRGVDDPNMDSSRKYPYAYYSLNQLGLIKDQQSIKTTARHSMGMTLDELANAVLKKAYLFPSQITVDLHYVTNDIVQAMDM